MQKITRSLPTKGYAVVVDGLIKTEFETREGATANVVFLHCK